MECPGLLGRGAKGVEKSGIFFALKRLPGDLNVSLAALDAGPGDSLLLRMECAGLFGRCAFDISCCDNLENFGIGRALN